MVIVIVVVGVLSMSVAMRLMHHVMEPLEAPFQIQSLAAIQVSVVALEIGEPAPQFTDVFMELPCLPSRERAVLKSVFDTLVGMVDLLNDAAASVVLPVTVPTLVVATFVMSLGARWGCRCKRGSGHQRDNEQLHVTSLSSHRG